MSSSASNWLNYLSRAWAIEPLLMLWVSPNTLCAGSIVGLCCMAGYVLWRNRLSSSIRLRSRRKLSNATLLARQRWILRVNLACHQQQLVRGWSWKWRKDGDDALKPKPKGRPKGSVTPKPLSEEDKLRRENERLRAENAYLKKLRDLRNQGRA